MATLQFLFELRGAPEHLRSDHGPEFIAQAVKDWLLKSKVGTLYIEPGSPWQPWQPVGKPLQRIVHQPVVGRTFEPGFVGDVADRGCRATTSAPATTSMLRT